ncbi:hypothetical protein TcYC6_0104680 [Trypanosoma cruzi]|nr:hypothetical protein TcYC6_0104680 [Trypanosoma cruzi]RNC52094.1 hypothetical protein TcCL_ESM10724 [Trypanosoma cruzi]
MHGSPKVQQLVGGGIARQEARWLQSQLGLDDVPDACGRNAFHELAGAAAQRYRSVGGRGWMPFSPDWAGVAKPRVADSAGRPLHVGGYRTARGRHASPHGLDGAVPLHVFRRGQAPVPRATAVGCGRALPYLLGEVHRIRRYRWRRVGLWVPCCFCRLQLHGVADLRVSAEHWAIGFPGLRAQGTRGVNTAYYLPAVAVRALELGAERVPAAFGCFAQRFSATEVQPLTAFCVRCGGNGAVQFRQPWSPEWGRLVIPCRDRCLSSSPHS